MRESADCAREFADSHRLGGFLEARLLPADFVMP